MYYFSTWVITILSKNLGVIKKEYFLKVFTAFFIPNYYSIVEFHPAHYNNDAPLLYFGWCTVCVSAAFAFVSD